MSIAIDSFVVKPNWCQVYFLSWALMVETISQKARYLDISYLNLFSLNAMGEHPAFQLLRRG